MTDRINEAKKQAMEEIEARYKGRIQQLCPNGLNEARIRKNKQEKLRRSHQAQARNASQASSGSRPTEVVAQAVVVYSMVSPSAPSPPRKPRPAYSPPRVPQVQAGLVPHPPDGNDPRRKEIVNWCFLLSNILLVVSTCVLLWCMYLEFWQ